MDLSSPVNAKNKLKSSLNVDKARMDPINPYHVDKIIGNAKRALIKIPKNS